MLVGQLGCYMPHHLSQIINQDRPSNHKEELVFSCLHSVQCTMYNVHVSQDFTLRTGPIPIKVALCVCTGPIVQKKWHNTTQHSTVLTICPNLRSSSYLSVLFRPPSDANENWLIWFLSSILLRSNPREKKRAKCAGYAINCFQ